MYERRKVLELFDKYREETDQRIHHGIEQHRKGYGYITLQDEKGEPIRDVCIQLRQKTHEFRFGANLFMLGELETEEKNELYKQHFARLFNMATLPFYWDSTEPEKGALRYQADAPKLYRRPAIDKCVTFCKEHGIEPREHALAYDHFFPDWLVGEDVATCKRELERRYKEIAGRYAEDIPTIEVTNEMFWKEGKTALYRADDFMDWCYQKAEEHFPYNHLTINEAQPEAFKNFYGNMSAYYLQIERLLKAGRRVDAIGMQYHMMCRSAETEYEFTRPYYDPLKLYAVLDRYSDFGKPLQITEMTIPCFSDRAEDEQLQADILEQVYSLFFSHPNMEQIIYWNLPDGYAYGAKQGDMTTGENRFFGGLLRFDLSPKPAFERLEELIHHRWHTDATVTTDKQGRAVFKGFYGDYEAEINGKKLSLTLKKGKANEFSFHI